MNCFSHFSFLSFKLTLISLLLKSSDCFKSTLALLFLALCLCLYLSLFWKTCFSFWPSRLFCSFSFSSMASYAFVCLRLVSTRGFIPINDNFPSLNFFLSKSSMGLAKRFSLVMPVSSSSESRLPITVSFGYSLSYSV